MCPTAMCTILTELGNHLTGNQARLHVLRRSLKTMWVLFPFNRRARRPRLHRRELPHEVMRSRSTDGTGDWDRSSFYKGFDIQAVRFCRRVHVYCIYVVCVGYGVIVGTKNTSYRVFPLGRPSLSPACALGRYRKRAAFVQLR